MRNRIIEYDVMKAIAIVLVVLGHSYFLGSHGISMSAYIDLSENTIARVFNNQISDWIYSFHMPVFMAISGALSCSKFEELGNTSFKDYAISRFKRLMIPFYVVGIIYAVPVKYIAGYYFDWSLIKSFIWSLVIMQTPAHLWFLVTVFLFDIAFGALSKRNKQYSKVVFPLLMSLFLVSSYFNSVHHLLYRLFQNAIWFYVGLCFEHYEIRKKLSGAGRPKSQNEELKNGKSGGTNPQSSSLSLDSHQISMKNDVKVVNQKTTNDILGQPGGYHSLQSLLCFISLGLILYISSCVHTNIFDGIINNFFVLIEAIFGCLGVYELSICLVNRGWENSRLGKILIGWNFEIYLYHEPIIHLLVSIFISTGFVYTMQSNLGYAFSIIIRFFISFGGAILIGFIVRKIKNYVCCHST